MLKRELMPAEIERLYLLRRDLLRLRSAVVPLVEVCRKLEHAEVLAIEPSMQPLFRDVTDHIRRVQEEIDALREMETPDVKLGLSLAISQGQLTGVDLSALTYYLGHESIVPSGRVPGMSVWREAMFALFHRNAERSAAYFCVPSRQVVQIGVEIEI